MKKLRVFIADDEQIFVNEIENLVGIWAKVHGFLLEFLSKNSLCADDINSLCNFDVAFLDIEMPEIGGLEFSKLLRCKNESIYIVFVTSHHEFSLSGYDVQALQYVIKPATKNAINSCMDYIVKHKLKDAKNKRFVIKNGGSAAVYKQDDVLYFQADGHYVKIFTSSGVDRQNTSITELIAKINVPPFFICHRSYIINMNHVLLLDGSNALMKDNAKIPISRQKLQQFKKAFLNYYEGFLT